MRSASQWQKTFDRFTLHKGLCIYARALRCDTIGNGSRAHPRISWRKFSSTTTQLDSKPVSELPPRRQARYLHRQSSDLLCLEWPEPLRNILLIKKDCTTDTTEALTEFASHIKSTYPETNIIVEPQVAAELGRGATFDTFVAPASDHHAPCAYDSKVDLITTFGGDGTILHAASLFARATSVPPVLSFSMGTLGFLGEWKFSEYKRAFREVYMSGATSERQSILEPPSSSSSSSSGEGTTSNGRTGWSSVRGKSLGATRGAKMLIRHRLKVGVYDAHGNRLHSNNDNNDSSHRDADLSTDMHAMNEVILHRGQNPHLAIVEIFVGGRFLTEAVADGMIISTPTGSTAYSLSSGGSIIHPLVPSLLLTPICARSLSFRPLVLPATTPITLKLSQKSRGKEVELSIDGIRRSHGIGVGTEVRVSGEEVRSQDGVWTGGIPCVLRQSRGGAVEGDDGWVGGLNGLLKFNYPFGEER